MHWFEHLLTWMYFSMNLPLINGEFRLVYSLPTELHCSYTICHFYRITNFRSYLTFFNSIMFVECAVKVHTTPFLEIRVFKTSQTVLTFKIDGFFAATATHMATKGLGQKFLIVKGFPWRISRIKIFVQRWANEEVVATRGKLDNWQ